MDQLARTIRLYPASLTDLVDIVREASAAGVELHALGSSSGHVQGVDSP
ncbi:hypothetical protein [Herbidospora cretacea]|nr:hypothetical protein [Herbidospora cretacea]